MIRTRMIIAAAIVAAMFATQAEAGLLFRKASEPPAEVLAPIPATAYYANAGGPGCCQPVPCCPAACIKYRHLGIKVKCCGCPAPYQTMLTTTNPCTCCPVNIPVCLPGCCTGAPCVTCRPTLIGEGLVKYEWCCGVTVTVRFQRDGDVTVTYWHA